MEKVYIVLKRDYRAYANCEPHVDEMILRVFETFDKAVTYVEDRFVKDHERINNTCLNLKSWTKHYPQRNGLSRELYNISIEYEDGHAYDSRAYKIKPYDVE